jgi:ubiquinone/menaquinone biosynthesis C-methylase UbiE
MKTQWDYTELADAYLKRPDYSAKAILRLIALSGAKGGDHVCDMGAGAGHLTLHLAEAGLAVTAVEPNDAMRANGVRRTAKYPHVSWIEATGEKTGLPDASFAMVTFGSSFNVTDRQKTLAETARILRPGGMFACMWNHRDLADPIQAEIEAIIKGAIPEYGYGTRREDQTEVINKSGLFGKVEKIAGEVSHVQKVEDCIEAWRSHATLERQAGEKFLEIVRGIETYLRGLGKDSITVPYATRIWAAKKA